MHHAAMRERAPVATFVALLLQVAVFSVGLLVLPDTGWRSSSAALADFVHNALELAPTAMLWYRHAWRVLAAWLEDTTRWFVRCGMLLGGSWAIAQSLLRVFDAQPLASAQVVVVALAGLIGNLGAGIALGLASLRLDGGVHRSLRLEFKHRLVDSGGDLAAVVGIWLAASAGVAWADPVAGVVLGLLMIVLVIEDVWKERRS